MEASLGASLTMSEDGVLPKNVITYLLQNMSLLKADIIRGFLPTTSPGHSPQITVMSIENPVSAENPISVGLHVGSGVGNITVI